MLDLPPRPPGQMDVEECIQIAKLDEQGAGFASSAAQRIANSGHKPARPTERKPLTIKQIVAARLKETDHDRTHHRRAHPSSGEQAHEAELAQVEQVERDRVRTVAAKWLEQWGLPADLPPGEQGNPAECVLAHALGGNFPGQHW